MEQLLLLEPIVNANGKRNFKGDPHKNNRL